MLPVEAGDDRVADLHSELGRQYRAAGDLENAEAAYAESLALREDALGTRHPYLMGTLRALAGVYAEQGRLGDAEYLRARVAVLHREAWGEAPDPCGCCATESGSADPDPAARRIAELDRATSTLGAAGRSRESLAAGLEALGLREERYGPDSLELAKGLTRTARLRQAVGAFEDALEDQQRALAIVESVEGTPSYLVADAIAGLRRALRGAGRAEEADELLDRELALRELGRQRLPAARLMEAIARNSRDRGDCASAAAWSRRAAEQWADLVGTDLFSRERK